MAYSFLWGIVSKEFCDLVFMSLSAISIVIWLERQFWATATYMRKLEGHRGLSSVPQWWWHHLPSSFPKHRRGTKILTFMSPSAPVVCFPCEQDLDQLDAYAYVWRRIREKKDTLGIKQCDVYVTTVYNLGGSRTMERILSPGLRFPVQDSQDHSWESCGWALPHLLRT